MSSSAMHPSLEVVAPIREKVFGKGILRYFQKTPSSIVCPHFWELNWAYGCPFDCAYCYLQGTFWGKKEPRFVDLKSVLPTLEKAFEDKILEPSIFNSGELADSLMNPSIMENIADKFEEQNKHKLLLLTKSNNVGFLLNRPRKQTIVSFSLNAPEVARRWEKGAPSPEKRIEAAKKVNEIGYETRIRIDPMTPVKDWEKHYCDLVDMIFDAFEPSRITLGSLRGLQKTIRFCRDDSWTKYLIKDETGWGKKVGFALRLSLYSVVSNHLKEKHGFSEISLCKETPNIWKKLEMDPGSYLGPNQNNWEKCKCNCVW